MHQFHLVPARRQPALFRNGSLVIARLPKIDFLDDNVGKPVGINSHIGRRPIASFGNSDGD